MVKAIWIVAGVLGAIGLVVTGALASAVSTYNGFVTQGEAVDAQSHQVDVQYQRAFALIPQLTNLTEKYMKNEADVQKSVAALRSGAALSQGNLTQRDAYAAQLQSLVLLVGSRAENYPDLKSDALFDRTMNEMTNTQNKIAMEKVRYNDLVRDFNAHRRTCCIPVIVASAFGISPKEYVGYNDRPDQVPFPGSTI